MAMDIDRVPVAGTWWRHVRAGIDPLATGSPPGDGRWQRGAKVAAIYLADGEHTAWAEWYRMLAERALPPRLSLPRELWRVEVTLDAVADLSTADRLGRLGLGQPRPGRSSWPAYQEVGERVRAHGFAGLVGPSAARPQGRVLCVFMPATAGALVPTDPPRRVVEAPPPPRGLTT
jgi:RES domain-containing protein